MDPIDKDIRDELRLMFADKDPRPFVSEPCPDCGRIGGFLVNRDGSRWPQRCIPCDRRLHPESTPEV